MPHAWGSAWRADPAARAPAPGPAPCRRLAVASCLAAAGLLLSPLAVAAQAKHQFAVAMVELSEALEGAHGDERDRILATLDELQRALAQWDHEVRLVQTQVETGLPSAAPDLVVPMRLGLALTLLDQGRAGEAAEIVDVAIAGSPDAADAHLLRGLVTLAGGVSGDAVASFRRAWELDPRDPTAAYWLVHAAQIAGVPERAAGAAGTLVAMYRQLAASDAPAPAAPATPFRDHALFRDGAAEAPIVPLVRYQDAFAATAGGDYHRAVTLLREAAAADPLIVDPALAAEPARQGAAALARGDAAAAVERFAQAADRFPESSEARRLLGVAHAAARNVAASVGALEASTGIDARNERAHLALVTLLAAAGDLPRAREALARGLDAMPASGALRSFAATLAFQTNDWAGVLRHLEALPLSGVLAGRGHVLAEIARLHRRSGTTAAALDALWLRVRWDPNDAAAQLALGELYRTEGLAVPAFASFVAALMIAPDVADAHTGVGYVHLAAGRAEDAEIAFRRAIALRPDWADPRYGLATALERLGRRDEAAAALDAARRAR